MPFLPTGTQLRDHRRTRGWTQRACAAALGVTPNTVARWERGEVRIPALVGALLQTQRAAHDALLQAERAAQDAQTQVAAMDERVNVLKRTIMSLELKNLALEHHLRKKRSRMTQPIGKASNEKAEHVYKRLVRKYHPDRHPEHQAVMADINELWQASARSRR